MGAEFPGAAGDVAAFGGVAGEGGGGGGVEDVTGVVEVGCVYWIFYSWHDCIICMVWY